MITREEYILNSLRKTPEFIQMDELEWTRFLNDYYLGSLSAIHLEMFDSAIEKVRFKPNYSKETTGA